MKTCPACGATMVSSSIEMTDFHIPYGETVTIGLQRDQCSECGTDGDFDCQNDKKIETAIHDAVAASASNMIRDLVLDGNSMEYIERALRLPPKTLLRWNDGKISADGVALLRMVRTIPWLLQVADDGFKKETADRCALEHTAQRVGELEYQSERNL